MGMFRIYQETVFVSHLEELLLMGHALIQLHLVDKTKIKLLQMVFDCVYVNKVLLL